MRSLRVKLILLLGIAIAVAAAIQFTTSFREAMVRANSLFDYHMQQMALALQDNRFEQGDTTKFAGGSNRYEFVVQVWDARGEPVYQSSSAGPLPGRGELGYSNTRVDDTDWRLYAVQGYSGIVQIAQKTEARRRRAISLAWSALWPIIPVSLLLFIAAWWVVTTSLEPLNRVGHELANRTPDSLEPVSGDDVPAEVSLLVGEINALLTRVNDAIHTQQRFVADAAHELRSPLTALKLQVQTLARAKDRDAQVQGIARLQGGVDRASRLVEQLLALARQSSPVDNFDPVNLCLADCVELVIADMLPLAMARKTQIRYGELEHADIVGNADDINILVRNLLDNAIRYCPENSIVQVEITTNDDAVVLGIQDSGPGISESDRARVFDRFYRLPGTAASGSGLGMAIVKSVCERHGAQIALGDAALGGLAVTIRFPKTPQAAAHPRAAA